MIGYFIKWSGDRAQRVVRVDSETAAASWNWKTKSWRDGGAELSVDARYSGDYDQASEADVKQATAA